MTYLLTGPMQAVRTGSGRWSNVFLGEGYLNGSIVRLQYSSCFCCTVASRRNVTFQDAELMTRTLSVVFKK